MEDTGNTAEPLGAVGRTVRDVRRALRRRGRERDSLALVVKSTIASVTAWAIGSALADSPQVAFAPFSALLVVRPSVYGSVLQSGRYVAAVFFGAFFAGVVGLTLGPRLWTFTAVVLVALLVSRSRLFGEQGLQIPVVASFALAGGTATEPDDLWWLLAMVCVGSATALATNVVLAPAIRFRDAGGAVLDFAVGLEDFARDMADGMRRGWDGVRPGAWYRGAAGFDGTARNAEAAVERQEQRVPFNPRTVFHGRLPRTLHGYRGWTTTLSRSAQHLGSITRTLRSTAREDARHPVPTDDFLAAYAGLVDAAADAFRLVSELEEPERDSTSPELRRRLDAALERVEELRRAATAPGDPRRWPVYSALLTDIERVFEELYQGHGHGSSPDGHG